MFNSVILTIQMEQSDIEFDMELPTNIPGGELCEKLLVIVRNFEDQVFHNIKKINLRIERSKKMLDDDQTLEDAEVWDGSIITILEV